MSFLPLLSLALSSHRLGQRLKMKLWKSFFRHTSPNSMAEATMPSGLSRPMSGPSRPFKLSSINPRDPEPIDCRSRQLGFPNWCSSTRRISVLKEDSLREGAVVHTCRLPCPRFRFKTQVRLANTTATLPPTINNHGATTATTTTTINDPTTSCFCCYRYYCYLQTYYVFFCCYCCCYCCYCCSCGC